MPAVEPFVLPALASLIAIMVAYVAIRWVAPDQDDPEAGGPHKKSNKSSASMRKDRVRREHR